MFRSASAADFAAALAEAVTRAAPGATVTLIGLGGEATTVNTALVVRNQLTLRGSLIYDHPGDFARTIAGPVDSPGRVLCACYPLERASEAFRAANEVPGKTWILLS